MLVIRVLLTLLLASVVSYAQVPEYLKEDGTFKEYKSQLHKRDELSKYTNKPLAVEPRNYDVLRYDLFMDWTTALSSEPMLKEYTGVNLIELVTTEENVGFIELDALNLTITGIKVNGSNVEGFIAEEGLITIPMNGTLEKNTNLKIEISYKHDNISNVGFYLYPKNLFVGFSPTGDSVFTLERIAYTMSEPEDARRWMPCNDRPSDKARTSIAVKMPAEYTLATNGLLDSIIVENGTKTSYWSDTTLIPTYLMTATASIFEQFSYWYHPEGAEDSIEVINYVWAADVENEKTDWTVYNAKNALKNITGMMRDYSKLFGPYPYAKYGHVAIQPFNFGGMEHQTMTAINRSWLRGWSESGVAHELAHHWLGDLVTCETWDEIWFNEGGATWSEALWYESFMGYEGYLDYMVSTGNEYLRRQNIYSMPIYGIPPELIFSNPFYYLVYQKASFVYHQLRIMLGDEQFFTILRNLLKDYSFSTMTMEKFRDYFIKEAEFSPIPLDVFFEQALLKPAHPEFVISSSASKTSESSYRMNVRIEQEQNYEGAPEVFVSYVPVRFFTADTIVENFVVMNQRTQEFTFDLGFLPDSVTIDVRKILSKCNPAEVILSTYDELSDLSFNVSPSVVSLENQVNIEVGNSSSYFLLEVFDAFGKRVELVHQGLNFSGSTSFTFIPRNISSGVYFVKYTDSKNSITKKIIIN